MTTSYKLTTPAPATVAATVDRLAFIKAQIAELQAEETALKQTLVKAAERLGKDTLLGTTHRATIAHTEGRVTTDWRSVAEHLKPSRQLITAHTTQGEPVTSVRLYAHKTSA